MKIIAAVIVSCILFLNINSCTYDVKDVYEAKTEKKAEEIFTTNPEIKQTEPKKPVKIKLRRTATGKYSWDLRGDDVDEILEIDNRLRERLKTE